MMDDFTNDARSQSGASTNAFGEQLPTEMPAEERLSSLLVALTELHAYLDERGKHTYELAQRFIANSRRDASSRAYDERQATMLEYQHYIWHEIAGRVEHLLVAYGNDDDSTSDASGEVAAEGQESDPKS